MKSILLLSALLIVVGKPACALDEVLGLHPGTEIKSPNGRFVAKCIGGGILNEVGRVGIVDTRSHQEVTGIEVTPPVVVIKWTGDSSAMLLVTHIAGGTVAKVANLDGARWRYTMADPRAGDSYRVVGLAARKHVFDLTYTVKFEAHKRGESLVKFYICKFVFDPQRYLHQDEKRYPISRDVAARLRLD